GGNGYISIQCVGIGANFRGNGSSHCLAIGHGSASSAFSGTGSGHTNAIAFGSRFDGLNARMIAPLAIGSNTTPFNTGTFESATLGGITDQFQLSSATFTG